MSAGDCKEMYFAAESGNCALVQGHLVNGIDPNYQHPEMMQIALAVSVKCGHKDVVKLLLRFGADPELRTVLDGIDAREAAVATIRLKFWHYLRLARHSIE